MPTVNIYYKEPELRTSAAHMAQILPDFLTILLSGPAISLKQNEITTRVIHVESGAMIANIEIEITAHAFKERVEKQDDICRKVRDYLLEKYPECKDVRIWLKLSQLGHSW